MFRQHNNERRPPSVTSLNSNDTTASGLGEKHSKSGSSNSKETKDKNKHDSDEKSSSDFNIEGNIYGRAKSGRHDDFAAIACNNMNGNKKYETVGVGIYHENENIKGHRDHLYSREARSSKDIYYKNGDRDVKNGKGSDETIDYDTHTDKSGKASSHSSRRSHFDELYKADSPYRNNGHRNKSDGQYESSDRDIQDDIERAKRDYFYPRYRGDEIHDRNADDSVSAKTRENTVKSYKDHEGQRHSGNRSEDSQERSCESREKRPKSPGDFYRHREKVREVHSTREAHGIHSKTRERSDEFQNSYYGPPDRPDEGPGRYHGPVERPDKGQTSYYGPPERPGEGSGRYQGPVERPDKGQTSYYGPPERPDKGPGRYHGPPCPARRPLPPRPRSEPVNMALPSKTTVPLKVWIVASASCFGVCAALVLATVVITKWGTGDDFTRREVFQHVPEPIYAPRPNTEIAKSSTESEVPLSESEETGNEIEFPILEKLGIFKNIVANREPKQNDKKHLTLASKPQFHPLHENMHHVERKIEKKDQAKYPHQITNAQIDHHRQRTNNIASDLHDNNLERKLNIKYKSKVPEFKPKLPDVFLSKDIHSILSKIRRPDIDYEEYYNDENLYSDYMESNTMTSYLIEKVQELHDWVIKDPDFEISANITKANSGKMSNDFGQLLKALNESLIEGNVTIVMNKLKDIYFGANYTHTNQSRNVILSNGTDLFSFGILTLDIMLLHNIQLMAWENQEQARGKMLKDPDVFAFNALFLEPAKVEAKHNEVSNLIHRDNNGFLKRQSLRPAPEDRTTELDLSRNLLEDVLEMGMSTARAAIHLGRAYKNTKIVLNQLSNSNKEALNTNIQSQMSRNVDGNTHALQHLQTSFNSSANVTGYTELDCVWLLYCKNLVATSKLNPPYGPMARINGIALRVVTGELAVDRALDTMLYEALAGWTELRCIHMFPRCSHVNAASVVLESILAPMRKGAGSSSGVKSGGPSNGSGGGAGSSNGGAEGVRDPAPAAEGARDPATAADSIHSLYAS